MKIGKENIESFIFDYHEGNLSDSEKAEVLNYIHTHPEYEVEFTQWAQSYLLHEATIENYGLTNQLLQNPAASWHNRSWIKITAPVLLLAFVSFFYVTSKKPKVAAIPKDTTTPKKHSTIEATSNIATESKSIRKANVQQSSAPIHYNTLSNLQSSNNPIADSSLIAAPIESTTTNTLHSANSIQENNLVSLDSTTNKTTIAVPDKKTDLKKKRNPYKIKPATDFIPTNPDF